MLKGFGIYGKINAQVELSSSQFYKCTKWEKDFSRISYPVLVFLGFFKKKNIELHSINNVQNCVYYFFSLKKQIWRILYTCLHWRRGQTCKYGWEPRCPGPDLRPEERPEATTASLPFFSKRLWSKGTIASTHVYLVQAWEEAGRGLLPILP